MKKSIAMILCALTLAGCMTTPEARLKDHGRQKSIKIGMKKRHLLVNLGTELVTVRNTKGDVRAIVTNPYETQTLQSGGRTYEVVIYFLNSKPTDGPITDAELEPFVLENGRLIGRGWDFYRSLGLERG